MPTAPPAPRLQPPPEATLRRYPEIIAAFHEVSLRAIDGTPLDDVLGLIGQRLCDLLDVSRCSVYLRAEDGQLFQGRAGWCRSTNINDKVRRLVAGVEGDRFTQEIAATGAAVLITDARHDPRTLHQTMDRWGVRSQLGVPLMVERDTIGIIYVDNEDQPHEYISEEVAVAEAFAHLAAVAVRQRSLYEELQERARVIDRQRLNLKQMARVHSRLTRAVLDGADVQALLDLVCDIVGKPVLSYTPDMTVTAWSGPDALSLTRPPALTKQAVALPWIAHTIGQLQHGRSSVLLPAALEAGLLTRRLICRMVYQGVDAGYLEITEMGSALSFIDAKVLERAAMAVSLQILIEQRQVDAEGQAREDFLADLVYGRRDSSALQRRCPLFGVEADAEHVLLRVQYQPDPRAGERGLARRTEAISLIDTALGSETLLSTGVPGADLVLARLSDGPEGQVLRDLRASLAAVFPVLRDKVGVAHLLISGACHGIGELPAASGGLRNIAELLQRSNTSPRVVLASDLGVVRLLSKEEGVHKALLFANELLREIVHHDSTAPGGAVLMPTLTAFLEQGGGVRLTARVLDVHENTVRYRLSRIRELSSIDPDDFQTLLDAWFAVRVLEMFGDDDTLSRTSP